VFRYRLHSVDGDDIGEATYPETIKIGELLFGAGRRFRVVDVVPFEEGHGESPFVGMLKVEAA
jgi:hypothetical protein